MRRLNACPVCGSPSIRFLYEGRTGRRPEDTTVWTIDSCEACGHAFINPQPGWQDLQKYYSEAYDPYDPNHGSTAESDDDALELARRQGELRHLPLPAGKRILDVGCGSGWFLRIAKRLGAVVKGVEPSATGARRARESNLDVFHGTLEAYLADGGIHERFDIITANHVIEHTPEPVVTLRAMRRFLAPGGIIWISAPNANCAFARKLLDGWHSTDLPYHLQHFSVESMSLAGSQAGLAIQRQYTYSLPAAVASSLRFYWRRKFFVPQRLTQRVSLIERWYAPRRAAQMDRNGEGEAIITEFREP